MNDGPGPHKRPSSIETKQSIHGDEWGVDTNNNNNNSNIGGPYSHFSFIHMYAVTQIHTYGTDTMDNTANIPLGTPREGSWEQGWLTKRGGKGAWTGQARKEILASRQCIRHNDQGWEAISSPPQSAHYQEAHQCMNPENTVWKTPCSATSCPFLLRSVLLRCSSRTRWVQGVLAHTGVISLRGLTFKLRHYSPGATVANGTWGIRNPIEARSIWQGRHCYLPSIYISILEGGLCNDVSIWPRLSFHQLYVLQRECMYSVWK